MGIPQDIYERLRAALPASVPILLPEEHRDPLSAAPVDAQGRPSVGAGERGLGAYLQQHPDGYVQLSEAQGTMTTLDGAGGLWMVQVDSLANSSEASEALAEQVRATLASRAGIQQTPYGLMTPPTRRRDAPGVYVTSLIFTARKGL